jgi:hypothetical protein
MAWRNNWISDEAMMALGQAMLGSGYGMYLQKLVTSR